MNNPKNEKARSLFSPKRLLLYAEILAYGFFALSMCFGTFDYLSVAAIAALFGAVTSFNIRFYEFRRSKREYFSNWLFQFRVFTLAIFAGMYLTNPRFIGADSGFAVWLGVPILFNVLYSIVCYKRENDGAKMPRRYYLLAAFPLVCLLLLCTAWSSRWIVTGGFPESLAKQVGEIAELKFERDYPEQKPQELRINMHDSALAEARTALGTSGSQYHLDEASQTLQYLVGDALPPELAEFKGRQVWAAPLAHEGLLTKISSSFFGGNHIPGYVILDAGKRGTAKLVKSLTIGGEKVSTEIRFSPSSLGFRNLARHQWAAGDKFSDCNTRHFVLDHQGLPHWILIRTEPFVWTDGTRVKGVVDINCASGRTTNYGIDELPEWIDLAFPDNVLIERATFWGKYRGGRVGTLKLEELYMPTTYPIGDGSTTEESAAIWQVARNGKMYSVTGLTNMNSRDETIVSIFDADCRTGKVSIYSVNGLCSDEHAVMKAVNGALTEHKGARRGTQPIVFRYPGTTAVSWFVPIVDNQNFNIQEYAIVYGKTREVFLGDTVDEVDRKYQRFLIDHNELTVRAEDLKRVTGRIAFVNISGGVGSEVIRFQLDSAPGLYFYAPGNLAETILWTKVGDEVTIGYAPNKERVLPVLSFKNLSHQ